MSDWMKIKIWMGVAIAFFAAQVVWTIAKIVEADEQLRNCTCSQKEAGSRTHEHPTPNTKGTEE